VGGCFLKADYIIVKREAGDQHPLHIVMDFEADTIDNIKTKIREVSEAEEFQLIFHGKVSEPCRRLKEYATKGGEVF
jgi:hypothetical protein